MSVLDGVLLAWLVLALHDALWELAAAARAGLAWAAGRKSR